MECVLLKEMMERFASGAETLIAELFRNYAATLERARTSYRPIEIAGRKTSPTSDDTRLHVDAFPTRPMHGRRILRLFSNVHPGSTPRVWNVGEPFADMAEKLLPHLTWHRTLEDLFRVVTLQQRGFRSPYDDLMMGLHDNAKLDMDYQRTTPKTKIAFAPGTTWLCYTDQVMHAALSGQFVLRTDVPSRRRRDGRTLPSTDQGAREDDGAGCWPDYSGQAFTRLAALIVPMPVGKS